MKKEIKFTSLLMATVFSFGLALTPATAQADYDAEVFGEYDLNNDNYWDENEWGDYTYNTIDYDSDGYIDENEWDDYSSVWYEPYQEDYTYSFNDYDLNNDGLLDDNEYGSAYDTTLFDTWDTNDNDLIDTYEYNDTVAMYSDYDNDGIYSW